MVVEICCEEVWREISKYLDGEISEEMRARMEEHFKGCKHCMAVLPSWIETLSGFSETVKRIASSSGIVQHTFASGSLENEVKSSEFLGSRRSQENAEGHATRVPPAIEMDGRVPADSESPQ